VLGEATQPSEDRLYKMGFILVGRAAEQFPALFKSELPVCERVVKLCGAKLN
jgi:hypothetical protein